MRNWLICYSLIFFHALSAWETDPAISHSVNIVLGEWQETAADLQSAGPRPLQLKRAYPYVGLEGVPEGWRFSFPNVGLVSTKTPASSLSKTINATYDTFNRLTAVIQNDPANKAPLHRFDFSYSNQNGKQFCTVTSDTGECLTYQWLPSFANEGGPILQQITFQDGSCIRYEYALLAKERRSLLMKRVDPNGNSIEITRYKQGDNHFAGLSIKISDAKDWRIGRIMGIKQKSADGLQEKVIATFVYRSGETEVIDSANHSQIYTYDALGRVTAIEAFLKEKKPYRIEKFFWDERSNLIAHALCNQAGTVLSSHTYTYDTKDRLLQEAIWGNLSGLGADSFAIGSKGRPTHKNVECHCIDYLYEGDSDRVIQKTENSGITLKYAYDPETNLETSKILSANGSDQLAQYSSYNSRGLLIEQIFVDLQAQENNKYRLVYELIEQPSLAGLPHKIIRYGSANTILDETLIEYTPCGYVQTKEKRTPSGILLERNSYQYDARGRIVLKLTHQGDCEETTYNANGQIIQKCVQEKGNKKTKHFSYNASGLCIAETTLENGIEISQTYAYDQIGNKISERRLDNQIFYTYDSLGRCLSKASLNAPYQMSHYAYREDGLPVSIQDGNGHETSIHYNIRRQPIEMRYADGTQERFVYSLDGSLIEKTTRNGWKTTFTKDFLGRETSATVYSPDGTVFQTTENVYNAFQLVSTRDEKGVKTSYNYDKNGKESLRRTESSAGTLFVVSTYNDDGDLVEQREWIENDSCSLVTTKITQTAQGNCIELFDSEGAKIRHQELLNQKEKAASTEWMLDKNSQDVAVLKCIETVPNGLKTVTLMDPRGTVCGTQEFSAQGELLSDKEFRYDNAGQKAAEINHFINAYGMTTGITRETHWHYGPCSRLERLEQIAEDGSVRTTLYGYNQNGQLISTLYPNGSQLTLTYDAMGRLQRQVSQDLSINYAYTYDAEGRVTLAQDLNTGVSVTRSYDALGHLVEESYHPQLSIKSTYDPRGRRTQLQLPDNSDILYQYDAIALKAIIRRDAHQNERYRHVYHYAQDGKISSLQPIGNLPEIQRIQNDREWKTTSPFWQQFVQMNTFGKPFNIAFQDNVGTSEEQFEHDDKGQLIKQHSPNSITYRYNCWGECLFKNENPFEYNTWGELLSALGRHFYYDANGNLIHQKTDDREQHFSYDALNRLIAVNEDRAKTRYTYDAFDRRLSKTRESWNEQNRQWVVEDVEYYLYDGNNEIAALDAQYRIKQLRILGEGLGGDIGAAVALEIEDKVYAPLHDFRGSVVALVDSETQTIAESYRYSAFGEMEIFDACGQKIEHSQRNNPWCFSSKRFDSETGWYYFGRRYYDAVIGRWTSQDPLATLDGGSTYNYVNNSPLQQIDLYGLFSIGGAWNSLKNGFQGFWNWKENTQQTLQEHLSIEHQLKGEVQSILEESLGYLFLSFAGYYNQPMEAGTYGSGQMQDKVRITFLNGIGNIRFDLGNTLQTLYKSHGNTPIHFIFFPTQGLGKDLLRCLFIKFGFTNPTAYALAETWKKLIVDMGGTENGGVIVHYAHSIGGSNTLAAASLLTPEERKMIRIITMGSASVIPSLGFENVMNYVSIRDLIPFLADPFGFLAAWWHHHTHVSFVGSLSGMPFADHALNFRTYVEILESLGAQFIQEFGLL